MATIDNTNKSAYLYSCSVTDRMKEICLPLETYFEISHFKYLKIFEDCSYLFLINGFEDFSKTYFSTISTVSHNWTNIVKKLTIINTPQIYFSPTTLTDSIIHLHYNYNIWNMMTIAYKTHNYYEGFNFAFNRYVNNKTNFFLKNSNTLIEFTKYFKIVAKDLIEPTNKSTLAIYKNKFDWLGNISQLSSENKKKQMFLNNIRTRIPSAPNFSPQEHLCIELLAQGRTMKEIGRMLSISPRTVESYVENIKDKTGCNFKSQIIDLYHQNKSWLDV